MFHETENELVNWIDCVSVRLSRICSHSSGGTSMHIYTLIESFPISIEHTMWSNVMCKRRKDINSFVILSQAEWTENWENKKMVYILLTFSSRNRTHVCYRYRFQSNVFTHIHKRMHRDSHTHTKILVFTLYSTLSISLFLTSIHIVWTTTDHIT